MRHTRKGGFHASLNLLDHRLAGGDQWVRLMYLKKVDGPRAITLPDGSIMSRADLPSVETRRWVASRQAKVVKAVAFGLITLKEALERYSLSEEEFEIWRSASEAHGIGALKVTAIQKYRQL